MSWSFLDGNSKVRGAQSLGSRQVFRTRNDTIVDQCVLLGSDVLGNARFPHGPLPALSRTDAQAEGQQRPGRFANLRFGPARNRMVRFRNCFAAEGKGKLGPEPPSKSLVPLSHLPYLLFMTSVVTSIREQITPILRERGVLRAGVFGSYARGEESSGSDLDLLVELPPGSSLLDLVGLQLDLAEELGVEVDAHTYRSLHPLLRDRILKEEVQIL